MLQDLFAHQEVGDKLAKRSLSTVLTQERVYLTAYSHAAA